jgi:endogenous inhibitor of DNA gyrase (YacG/DUF329 family)
MASCADQWFVEPILTHAANQTMDWVALCRARQTCWAWHRVLERPAAKRVRDFLGLQSDEDTWAVSHGVEAIDPAWSKLRDARGALLLRRLMHSGTASRAWLVRCLRETSVVRVDGGKRRLPDWSAFWAVCTAGDVEVVALLDRHYELDRAFATQTTPYNRQVFLTTCFCRRLDMLRWLAERFELTRDEARAYEAFRFACSRGEEALAVWLMDHFGVDVHPEHGPWHHKLAPMLALESGNLALIQKIAERFDLVPTTVREGARLAVAAGSCGKVDVFKWVSKRYSIQRKHVAVNSWPLVRTACRRGYLDLLKHLVSTYAIGGKSVRVQNNAAFRRACTQGHLDVAKWLTTEFSMTAEDARSQQNDALRGSCTRGNLDVATWLVRTFGLTHDDVRACGDAAMRGALRNAHVGTVVWLSTFGYNEPTRNEVWVRTERNSLLATLFMTF